LHPKIRVIIDGERKARDQAPQEKRLTFKARLQAAGIGCHLTELRATESYFTSRALQLVYGSCPPALDPFGDPNLANQGVKQFTKPRNGEVAQAMEWAELERTDVGHQLEDFLKF